MSEKIVQLNEEVIKGQIKELVRGSVEETLNELLEKEAEPLESVSLPRLPAVHAKNYKEYLIQEIQKTEDDGNIQESQEKIAGLNCLLAFFENIPF